MGSHDPFGHLKHKLWPKEESRVKLTIWLSTTKSKKLPLFRYVQVVCDISLESFDEGYNFVLDLISIGGLHAKLWAPKIVKVLIMGISKLPLGNSETKWHLDVDPVARHIVYYKGEGDGFPSSWGRGESCEFVFTHGSFLHQSATITH